MLVNGFGQYPTVVDVAILQAKKRKHRWTDIRVIGPRDHWMARSRHQQCPHWKEASMVRKGSASSICSNARPLPQPETRSCGRTSQCRLLRLSEMNRSYNKSRKRIHKDFCLHSALLISPPAMLSSSRRNSTKEN
jgi:hypothetical protein